MLLFLIEGVSSLNGVELVAEEESEKRTLEGRGRHLQSEHELNAKGDESGNSQTGEALARRPQQPVEGARRRRQKTR